MGNLLERPTKSQLNPKFNKLNFKKCQIQPMLYLYIHEIIGRSSTFPPQAESI